jgi:hypothetical protein
MFTLRREFRLFIAASVLLFSSLVSTSAVRADFYWGDYISAGDPINLIFDINGTWTNTYDRVLAYLGWYDRGGTTQQFPDHSSSPWENQNGQAGSDCDLCERYHLRYNQGNDSAAGWGTWTMAPAHYEQYTWCGAPYHKSSTYDGARNVVHNAFVNNGYTIGWVNRANNQAVRQCDGSYTAGDGWYVWIDI